MIRIGHGYDVHAFGGDKPLTLGGVSILGHTGLVAHSDGDVVLHAICDAVLGASALRDIGFHFPDTSSEFEGADSRGLLRQVFNLVDDKGFRINNLDVTIIAQTPRMSPHINEMQSNISSDLKLSSDQINVKATTTEGLGYIGRKQGIAVHCVCLIESRTPE
jgi:2-C-methyl-D-erythritol 2,4-cyclodiphosphate synthase